MTTRPIPPTPPGRGVGRNGTVGVECQLDPVADSVRAARLAVGDALRAARFAGDSDLVLLLTSEVVTNAVRHAATAISLSVRVVSDAAEVRVTDREPERPPMIRTVDDPRDPGGRGLQILDRMAQTWGVDVDGATKTVWFTIA